MNSVCYERLSIDATDADRFPTVYRSGRAAVVTAALARREAAPDSETLIMGERVVEAFLTDLAGGANALGLPGGATLVGKKCLGIGLGAQRLLMPGFVLGSVAAGEGFEHGVEIGEKQLHFLYPFNKFQKEKRAVCFTRGSFRSHH